MPLSDHSWSTEKYRRWKWKRCILCVKGFRPQAMAVTCDPEHKFELALQLGDLKIAYQLAKEMEVMRIVFCLAFKQDKKAKIYS